jgi:hypothetical protein
VSAAACLFAIAGVEIIADSSRQSKSGTTAAEPVAAPVGPSGRKAAKWLWLCVPALGYRIWHFFFGQSSANQWVFYFIGALTFVGLVGCVVVYSVSFLRATK